MTIWDGLIWGGTALTVLEGLVTLSNPQGSVVVRQGEAADHVYYVLRGRFEVLLGGRHLVAEIGAGEPVGEIAFFSGLPRTASRP